MAVTHWWKFNIMMGTNVRACCRACVQDHRATDGADGGGRWMTSFVDDANDESIQRVTDGGHLQLRLINGDRFGPTAAHATGETGLPPSDSGGPAPELSSPDFRRGFRPGGPGTATASIDRHPRLTWSLSPSRWRRIVGGAALAERLRVQTKCGGLGPATEAGRFGGGAEITAGPTRAAADGDWS